MSKRFQDVPREHRHSHQFRDDDDDLRSGAASRKDGKHRRSHLTLSWFKDADVDDEFDYWTDSHTH